MLERIKLLLNISDESKDALLGELIEDAEEYIVNQTNNPNCLGSLSRTIINMVIYDYNMSGNKGLTSENYSGVSFGYLNGYSKDIEDQIRKFRKVKMIVRKMSLI